MGNKRKLYRENMVGDEMRGHKPVRNKMMGDKMTGDRVRWR